MKHWLNRRFLAIGLAALATGLATASAAAQAEGSGPPPAEEADEPTSTLQIEQVDPTVEGRSVLGERTTAYVVPLQGQVGPPMLYILRRALKEAIANDVNTVVVDLDTPGGRLDVTLEMMEIIDDFQGDNIVYINDEAISAGAYISFAHDIVTFAPRALIGAAEAVQGTGEDIPESLNRKLESYLQARIRSLSQENPLKADVLRKMMDPDFIVEIDGEPLDHPNNVDGELLSLTSKEAVQLVGDPPQTLFGEGVYESVEDILDHRYGVGGYELVSFEITWSERLAQYLEVIAPALLGIGLLALFIEFKTPGFGLPGIVGLVFVAVVFLGNYVAGLAGYEPLLIFVIGALLLFVEIFFFPGLFALAVPGVLLMVGSLLWSLADVWPAQEGEGFSGFSVNADSLESALMRLLMGLAVTAVGFVVVGRFLPKTSMWGRIVLQDAVSSPGDDVTPEAIAGKPGPGAKGTAVSDLHPVGTVEINGQRYEASTESTWIDRGDGIRVVGTKSFGLRVEKAEN